MSTLYVDNLQPNLGSRVMAAGHVVQVVQATSTTNLTVSSGGGGTTWNDSGATVTITPTVASSKVLVLNSAQEYLKLQFRVLVAVGYLETSTVRVGMLLVNGQGKVIAQSLVAICRLIGIITT